MLLLFFCPHWQVFDHIDEDHSQSIQIEELERFLVPQPKATAGAPVTPTEEATTALRGPLRRMFEGIDAFMSKSGYSAYEVFELMDKNGGSSIDSKELHASLFEIGVKLSDLDISFVMAALDRDGAFLSNAGP